MTPHEYREVCRDLQSQADEWDRRRTTASYHTADVRRTGGDVSRALTDEAYAEAQYAYAVSQLRELRRRARDGEL